VVYWLVVNSGSIVTRILFENDPFKEKKKRSSFRECFKNRSSERAPFKNRSTVICIRIAVDRFFKLTSLFDRFFNRAFLLDRLLIGGIEKVHYF